MNEKIADEVWDYYDIDLWSGDHFYDADLYELVNEYLIEKEGLFEEEGGVEKVLGVSVSKIVRLITKRYYHG